MDARGNVGGRQRGGAQEDFVPERFERVDDVRATAEGAVGRGRSSAPRRRPRPPGPGSAGADAREELIKVLGDTKGARAADRLRDAARAFERDRFEEARSLLRPIAEQAPGAPSVRELYGLTLYRLGRWKDAVRELEAFRTATGSTEQHPVLADCYRALKRWSSVDELWEELREASPSPELVSEGRIVVAGGLADRGQLAAAIDLLERSPRPSQKVQLRHLREAYVLADLYERSGDLARARQLFRFVATDEPDFADAVERAASLG